MNINSLRCQIFVVIPKNNIYIGLFVTKSNMILFFYQYRSILSTPQFSLSMAYAKLMKYEERLFRDNIEIYRDNK